MTPMLRALLLLLATPGLCLAAVTPLAGTTPQVTKVGQAFAVDLAVRVTDANGAPVAGATLYYSDPSSVTRALGAGPTPCYRENWGSYSCRAISGPDGVAVFPHLQGHWAGRIDATVTAEKDGTNFGMVRMDLRVEPAQPPAVLELTRGGDQRVEIGKPLSPLVARLTSASGAPLVGHPLYLTPFDWNTGNRGGFEGVPLGQSTVMTGSGGVVQLPAFRASWGVGPQSGRIFYRDEAAGATVEVVIRYTATNAAGEEALSLQDLWWGGPTENGWGVSVVQHGDRLFNVFFVYDDQGQPTWFVQPGGQWEGGLGDMHYGNLSSTVGAPWYAYNVSAFTVNSEQQGYVRFMGPQNARLDIDYGGSNLRYTWKTLVRQDFRRPSALPARGVGDMWWGGPTQNGWGVAIHEQDGNLFIVWFTYDAAGRPTWFVMPDGAWSADGATFGGAIYRTRSSAWFGGTYDPAKLRSETVGNFSLRFDGAQRAALEYSLEGRSGILNLERQPF
jgi:hypothetical protein